MSRRNRTAELLAAAGLVPQQLAIERERSGREADNRNAWLQAAASLIPQAVGAVGSIRDGLDDAELSKALEFAGKNADVVDINDARARIDAEGSLAAPAKTGNPIQDFFSDPIGIVSGGRQKGRAAAADALSKSAMSNQTKAVAAEQAQARLDLTRDIATDRNSVTVTKEAGVDKRAANNLDLQRDKLTAKQEADAAKLEAAAKEKADKAKRAAAGAPARSKAAAAKEADRAIARATAQARLDALNKKAAEGEKLTPLSGDLAEKRALKVSGLKMLPELRELKKKVGTGPIEGPVKDALGFVVENPDRKRFALVSTAVQRTIGKILEGGKLAEGDAKEYRRFVLNPNSMDDNEYLAVLDAAEEFLINDLATFDEEQRNAGRQVGPRANAPAATAPTGKPSTSFITPDFVED